MQTEYHGIYSPKNKAPDLTHIPPKLPKAALVDKNVVPAAYKVLDDLKFEMITSIEILLLNEVMAIIETCRKTLVAT